MGDLWQRLSANWCQEVVLVLNKLVVQSNWGTVVVVYYKWFSSAEKVLVQMARQGKILVRKTLLIKADETGQTLLLDVTLPYWVCSFSAFMAFVTTIFLLLLLVVVVVVVVVVESLAELFLFFAAAAVNTKHFLLEFCVKNVKKERRLT